jgi:hypothetical protein
VAKLRTVTFHGEVGRRIGRAVHQPDVRAGGGLPQGGDGLLGRQPVLRAKVAQQPQHLGRPGLRREQRGGRRHGRPGPGAAGGRLEPLDFGPGGTHRFRRRRPAIDREPGAGSGGQPREGADDELGRTATAGQRRQHGVGDPLRPIERRDVAADAGRGGVGHREAVVEEQHVQRPPAAEQPAEGVRPARLGEGEHDARHHRGPHRQEQQLLEEYPRAVLPLAGEEELQRREPHPAVAEEIDEMDHQGRGRERQSPPEQRLEIEGGHRNVASARPGQTANLARRERNLINAPSTGSPVRISA